MTRYDGVHTHDGTEHPLAGVPQEALDAARDALRDSVQPDRSQPDMYVFDADLLEPIAHAVLMAAMIALSGEMHAAIGAEPPAWDGGLEL